ncbi:hypothetical protein [Streptomyces sp. NPDC047070]
MTEKRAAVPEQQGSQWYDSEAGPLVRPHTCPTSASCARSSTD